MKKRIAGIVLTVLMCSMLFSACGKNNTATKSAEESTETEQEGTGEIKEEENSTLEGYVGILLPDSEEESRYEKDVETMRMDYMEQGYGAEVLYAGGSKERQQQQIRDMISSNVSALIVAPVDPYSLTEVLAEAKAASISVFSYDSLVMDTENLSYYVTYNRRKVGQIVGEHIVDQMKLKEARENGETHSIEFLMGAPDQVDELFFYNGVMEILQEYLEDGTLECRSGRISFDDTALTRANKENAVKYLDTILNEYYSEEELDILVTAVDTYAAGAVELFDRRAGERTSGTQNSTGLEGTIADPAGNTEIAEEELNAKEQQQTPDYPYITTVNCGLEAMYALVNGKIQMTVFMDNRKLAEAMVDTVATVLKGETPELSDYEQYDNGVKIIRTITVDPQVIDGTNYEILVDTGYFEEGQLRPDPTATPTPEPTQTPEPSITSEPTEATEITPTSEPELTTEPEATQIPEPTNSELTPTPAPESTTEPTGEPEKTP